MYVYVHVHAHDHGVQKRALDLQSWSYKRLPGA